MYHPKKSTGGIYLILLFIIAGFFGLFLFMYYRPMIIEAACSDVAVKSGNLLSDNPDYTYENIKSRCLDDALSNIIFQL